VIRILGIVYCSGNLKPLRGVASGYQELSTQFAHCKIMDYHSEVKRSECRICGMPSILYR
jgi:hypothetical protein